MCGWVHGIASQPKLYSGWEAMPCIASQDSGTDICCLERSLAGVINIINAAACCSTTLQTLNRVPFSVSEVALQHSEHDDEVDGCMNIWTLWTQVPGDWTRFPCKLPHFPSWHLLAILDILACPSAVTIHCPDFHWTVQCVQYVQYITWQSVASQDSPWAMTPGVHRVSWSCAGAKWSHWQMGGLIYQIYRIESDEPAIPAWFYWPIAGKSGKQHGVVVHGGKMWEGCWYVLIMLIVF